MPKIVLVGNMTTWLNAFVSLKRLKKAKELCRENLREYIFSAPVNPNCLLQSFRCLSLLPSWHESFLPLPISAKASEWKSNVVLLRAFSDKCYPKSTRWSGFKWVAQITAAEHSCLTPHPVWSWGPGVTGHRCQGSLRSYWGRTSTDKRGRWCMSLSFSPRNINRWTVVCVVCCYMQYSWKIS